MHTGDLLGSGTISGPTKEERGCLLELTERGKVPVQISEGVTRAFLCDGDTVTLRGVGTLPDGFCVGFGDCVGTVVRAYSTQATPVRPITQEDSSNRTETDSPKRVTGRVNRRNQVAAQAKTGTVNRRNGSQSRARP